MAKFSRGLIVFEIYLSALFFIAILFTALWSLASSDKSKDSVAIEINQFLPDLDSL